MKLDLNDAPPNLPQTQPIEPGGLFMTSHGTYYLLVALKSRGALSGDVADCIHFGRDGAPTGTKSFGAAYLERLTRVGSVPALLSVEWVNAD